MTNLARIILETENKEKNAGTKRVIGKIYEHTVGENLLVSIESMF